MKFFIPAEFSKSEKDKEMRIFGFASTPDMDREEETVVQQGLDIDDFVNHGFFNYNHDNSYILGYPDKTKTKITKDGLYVEGNILPSEMGKRIWDAAVAMKKSRAPRKMGFSIEGKVLERDKNGKILKAKVYNVAITNMPVNPNATWEALVKGMTSAENSGGVFVKESLEHARHFLQRVEDGEESSVLAYKSLMNNLNKSKKPEDVEVYLSMFKGFFGDELKETLLKVQKELEEQSE